MPDWEIQYHPLAIQEFVAARREYARKSVRAAQRFTIAVNQVLQRIVDGPEQWPLFLNQYRWVKPHRFPYVLYYEIRPNYQIAIMAVTHAHRRPGYWLRRRLRP